MQQSSKKVINAWAMYDWANSAYNLVITSTVFPAYYESITGDGNPLTTDRVRFLGYDFVNSSLYNYALAFAFLVVAIISPLLSSIADTRGNKKSFMGFFLTMGSIACCTLFFFNKETLWIGLLSTIIACIGYWASLVFYNSYLPEIAPYEERDRVSAKGFAYGYVGSVILQLICFLFILKPDWFGIKDGSFAPRLSFLLVGFWWFGFAQIPLKRLPVYRPHNIDPRKSAITNGYRELQKVWHELKQLPSLRRFLASFFFYDISVQTVMLVAALYGTSELQIPTTNLIVSIVLIQLVAIPGAFLISKLSQLIGNIPALMVCVVAWIGLCIGGYLLPTGDINKFYALAVGIGFIMGGIQSLSRSTYSKLMPQTKDTTSFFSFFDVTEKIAIVIGTFLFGLITQFTGSQRTSVLVLIAFFVIGLLLLLYTLQAQRSRPLASETLEVEKNLTA
ncbi:MFS transporter [Chitinophagaceae bacterium LB-8]|uniref:MFS transporter n=1 Tax=Paraflavisolibacter caeni TaxID=2982496 RepID=A0A9X2Y0I9_9BACT|nr:MFS transporter [Paraflavisolibacter caeni]MCU7552415.1 MFS transporter [Paraflavisolibacter caeni]